VIIWVREVLKRIVDGDYPHPDDHTIRTIDTPGFKPFTLMEVFLSLFLSVPSMCSFTLQGPGASFQYCVIVHWHKLNNPFLYMNQSQSLIYSL